MKTFFQFILLLIVLAVAGIVLSYVIHMREPKNGPDGTPSLSNLAPDPVQVVAIKEGASSTPSIDVKYPQIPSLGADFNKKIKDAVEARLSEFRENSGNNAEAGVPSSSFTFNADWKQAQVSPRYVSFVIYFYSYEGGANGRQEMETFNYDVKKGAWLALADLFPGKADYLKSVSREARAELMKKFTAVGGNDSATSQLNAGTEPKPENFKYFTFTDTDLTLYFPKYAVGPGAFGEQEVTISMNRLR